ncbi:hypothetical protein H0266_07005 [Halobacillus locisalis]|uniref:DUF4367 domain-containing protein n=1 Tax=Halobacillus locisalis TaxID=220753 RepID=A0A838CS08_9BACI|nr:hypothetical protein [Halobacillus locisalis]MBA2174658.1 hypothetical protein [Halobacillus locisalis]
MNGKQKCQLLWITLVITLLSACGSTAQQIPEGYYAFNNGEVDMAKDQLAFEPELPQYIPFDMVSVVSDVYREDERQVFDVSFYTEANDLLSITVVEGKESIQSIDPIKVSISNQIEGTYEDNQFAKRLSWQKDGITYTIAYRESVHSNLEDEQSVTKEHLIEVARSFHL